MIQVCNDEYWKGLENIRDRNPEAPCGRTFDDFDQSTQCPHEHFPPNLDGLVKP
jgi:hypothetical protein